MTLEMSAPVVGASGGRPPETVPRRGRSGTAGGVAGTARRAGGDASGARQGGAVVQDLLRELAALPAGHPARAALRTRGIEAGLPLARHLAARYRGRGEPLEDLYQVAALALVKAVDGYRPARQVPFAAYAVPTILGELKRYFRDATWRVRVARPIQELAIRLTPATAWLTQHLGRSPELPDLAAHLGATEEEVAIALDALQTYHPGSLDALWDADEHEGRPRVGMLGAIDTRFDTVTDLHAIKPLLAALPARELRILAMRFSGDMTQAEIAAQIGVSQMQVSRLLTATLARLRTGLLTDQPPRPVRRTRR